MALKSAIISIVAMVGELGASLKFRVLSIWQAFDIRDLLVFGGLFSLSYGFYSLFSWLGFVVLGSVSMLLGLGWIVRRPKI